MTKTNDVPHIQIGSSILDYFDRMTPDACKVYMVLMIHFNTKTYLAWPSHQTISEEADMHIDTVRTALKLLETLGIVTVTKRGGQDRGSNIYLISNFKQTFPNQALVPVAKTKSKSRKTPKKEQKVEVEESTPQVEETTGYKAYLEAIANIPSLLPWKVETFLKKTAGRTEKEVVFAYKKLAKESNSKSREIFAKSPDMMFKTYEKAIKSSIAGEELEVKKQIDKLKEKFKDQASKLTLPTALERNVITQEEMDYYNATKGTLFYAIWPE